MFPAATHRALIIGSERAGSTAGNAKGRLLGGALEDFARRADLVPAHACLHQRSGQPRGQVERKPMRRRAPRGAPLPEHAHQLADRLRPDEFGNARAFGGKADRGDVPEGRLARDRHRAGVGDVFRDVALVVDARPARDRASGRPANSSVIAATTQSAGAPEHAYSRSPYARQRRDRGRTKAGGSRRSICAPARRPTRRRRASRAASASTRKPGAPMPSSLQTRMRIAMLERRRNRRWRAIASSCGRCGASLRSTGAVARMPEHASSRRSRATIARFSASVGCVGSRIQLASRCATMRSPGAVGRQMPGEKRRMPQARASVAGSRATDRSSPCRRGRGAPRAATDRLRRQSTASPQAAPRGGPRHPAHQPARAVDLRTQRVAHSGCERERARRRWRGVPPSARSSGVGSTHPCGCAAIHAAICRARSSTVDVVVTVRRVDRDRIAARDRVHREDAARRHDVAAIVEAAFARRPRCTRRRRPCGRSDRSRCASGPSDSAPSPTGRRSTTAPRTSARCVGSSRSLRGDASASRRHSAVMKMRPRKPPRDAPAERRDVIFVARASPRSRRCRADASRRWRDSSRRCRARSSSRRRRAAAR